MRGLGLVSVGIPALSGWRSLLSPSLAFGPAGPDQQQPSTTASTDRVAMAGRVREEFLHAWNGYKRYAWGHDELKPLSKGYHDWHSVSLLMTPVGTSRSPSGCWAAW